MKTPSGIVDVGRRVATEFSEKNVTFMAAGIAYNAFISLAPLLLVLLFAISAIGGGLEDRIVTLAWESLPRPIAATVADVFEGDAAPGASVVGLVVLIWGALKIFRGLDTAFSEIYETTGKNSLLDQIVDGIVVFVAALVATAATVGVTSAFAAFSDTIPYIGLFTPLVLVLGLIAAFYPMYYRFPDTDVRWKTVLPGVVFAAVGWAAFQSLFQVYLAFSGGDSGDLFGGVVVVVTWLYFSGLVFLLGAVINAVLGGHASGEAGGVGRGAADRETNREARMDREEFATYLARLREELTGRYEGMRPVTGVDDDRFPRPDGDITVIERVRPGEDRGQWEVAFRWRPADEDTESRSEPVDD